MLYNLEPKNYGAISRLPTSERNKWDASMDKEWNSILDKGVFDLIDITDVPKNVDIVPSQWVFKYAYVITHASSPCFLSCRMHPSQ